jgi:hypothetical protein
MLLCSEVPYFVGLFQDGLPDRDLQSVAQDSPPRTAQ